MKEYEVVVGLECHVQLLTQSKLFSPAKNQYGDEPNVNVDALDIALPGTLPVLNQKAVEFAVRLGLALGCEINTTSVFARKHYFYPDLPKGYQISQYDKPICGPGQLTFQTSEGPKTIGIERIHIEEDAGKNIHVEGGNSSYVDYNRAGTPLLEIVTRPDIRSAEEAMEAYRALRALVTYLGICDGNLQEGSMRADANVSIRPKGSTEFGTRTETKNLNSIKFLGQAVEFESRRQALELKAGHAIRQETRLWDSNRKESRALRSKEEAHDYRYFADPDLLPLILADGYVDEIDKNLPELPWQKQSRYQSELGLSAYDAGVLIVEKKIADYFESALRLHSHAKSVANWIINEMQLEPRITPSQLAELVRLIDEKAISGTIAKTIYEELIAHPEQSAEQIVDAKGLRMQRDTNQIQKLIEAICEQHPSEIQKYRSGKTQIFGFFVGQVMKQTQGKADPTLSSELLKKYLDRP
ncbi:MAG: Asp-tRNA(Asn)/Glu-tRNA(Gln) amidotransferase subunit GatB [Myxococcaceae bacterium]|nr:Asp-tRNA(Asn)/Glu-tRNA(Gln) amidotransferase subunit GatB [Myxococcaceae bacterium]MBH2006747.1 Asp-tRNA(Asn)/Glu-tRNA(Gln) amidotransferase subunit GatB [Myxococcaceae bacterium]